MDRAKNNVAKVRRVFYAFLILYLANLLIPIMGFGTYGRRMWFVINIVITILSFFFLGKFGLPHKRSIVVGLCLAILAGLTNPLAGIFTFIPYIAALSILEKSGGNVAILKRPIGLSVGIGLAVGFILGIVNLFLGGAQSFAFKPSFYAFIVSLNPGIYEEVVFRLFVYSFALHLLGGRINTRKERKWVYVLMILPHVLLHFPDSFFINGSLSIDLGSLLIGPVILSLLFGLPMAYLMLKRDLTTAMIVHTVVDFIRFSVFGFPF